MAIPYRTIADAFFFADSGGYGESEAILDRETGQVFCRSEEAGVLDEGFPDEDARDDPRYVALPDRKELDLGTRLVRRFADQCLSEKDADEVHRIFDRKGAYRRFKDFLIRRGAIDRWHAFENEAEERALRDWCAAEGIALSD